MYKLIISGTFITGGQNGERVDYDGVDVFLPDCNLDNAMSYIKMRVGAEYIKRDERYKDRRVDTIETIYIDSEPEKVDMVNPIEGKSVKEMSSFELQLFAIQSNLFLVPLMNQGSLRESREKALREYHDKVLGRPIKSDLLYNNIPDVKVDKIEKAEDEPKLTIEQSLNVSMKKEELVEKKEFTFEELKQLAKDSGIEFHTNIGYDKLYKRIFG